MDDKHQKVSSDKLEFDRHNPRLASSDENLLQASDEVIMRELVKDADIGELITSITTNTYMDIEPLIVTKEGAQTPGNFRVLEGNRRLTAIRFLQNPEIAKRCRLSIPKSISNEVLESLKVVSVYEVEDEREARAFIGFKHINGPHRWGSYAKARFISKWYQGDYNQGITVENIADKLGDENQQVRSLLGAMLVLEQAEELELFDIADRQKPGQFGFSHLYTALNRIEYRNFVGLDKDWNQYPTPKPVSTDHLDNLQEMLLYLYGSKKDDKKSLIESQNPDLKELGKVLSHTAALNVLRATHSLTASKERTFDGTQVFRDALIIAQSRVNEAFRKVSRFKPAAEDEDLYELADEMLFEVQNLHLLMKNLRP